MKYLYNTDMLVYEFKLKGRIAQYRAIDEAKGSFIIVPNACKRFQISV